MFFCMSDLYVWGFPVSGAENNVCFFIQWGKFTLVLIKVRGKNGRDMVCADFNAVGRIFYCRAR